MRITVYVLPVLASIPLVAPQYWAWPPSLFNQPCMFKCYDRLSTQDDLTGKCGSGEATGEVKNMTGTCMCESFKASDLHSCMSKCPDSQKDTFAAYLEGQCHDVFGTGGVSSVDEQPSSTGDIKAGETGAAVRKTPALIAGVAAALLI